MFRPEEGDPEIKNPLEPKFTAGFIVDAGAGFEPTTFGL
jgi:hypothetical protein